MANDPELKGETPASPEPPKSPETPDSPDTPNSPESSTGENPANPEPPDSPETSNSPASAGSDSSEAGKSPEAPESSESSPEKDAHVVKADTIENVPFRTTFAQKVFIAVFTLILIAVAVTFYDAGSRENQAAQATFSVAAQAMINDVADSTGLRTSYGYPAYTLNAKTKEADIFVEFLHGPLPPAKASQYGLAVCARLARAYVVKGYMPRHLTVHVYSRQDNGPRRYYGRAVFNGNLDDLVWENAPSHI